LLEKIFKRLPGNIGIIGKTLTSFSALGRIDIKKDLFVPDSMYVFFISCFGLLLVEVAI
jgi:hypothetical protein